MKRKLAFLIGLTALLASTLLAHHSFAAEFDTNSPVTLKGTVTKIEWQNPHVYIYIDVSDARKTVNWALESSPPNGFYRQGWRKDTLKPGNRISVQCLRAKDGSSLADVRTIMMPDGKKFFVRSANDRGPKQ